MLFPIKSVLHAFQLLVQCLLFLQAPLGLLPPLVLAVRLRFGRERRRGAKSGLLLAPVGTAERQDGGRRRGVVRAGGRVARQGV